MQKVCSRKLHWRKCWGGRLLRNVSQLDKNGGSLATRWRWHWEVQIFLFRTFLRQFPLFPPKLHNWVSTQTQTTNDGFHHAAVVTLWLAPVAWRHWTHFTPTAAAFWRNLDKCRDQCCIINVNVSRWKQTFDSALDMNCSSICRCRSNSYDWTLCHFLVPL